MSVDTVFFVNFQEHQAFHVKFHLRYLLSTFVCLIIFFRCLLERISADGPIYVFLWTNQCFVLKIAAIRSEMATMFKWRYKNPKKTYHVRLHRTKAYHKNGFFKIESNAFCMNRMTEWVTRSQQTIYWMNQQTPNIVEMVWNSIQTHTQARRESITVLQ